MQRKRIAVAAVAVVAAGAAVAFTLPSMAGDAPVRDRAPQAAAGDVTPEVLAAMKRDLGLDADQAVARLKRAAWASRVTSTLAVRTSGDYAGAWLAEDGMTLKVAVTRRSAARQVSAAGGQAVLVERSEEELDAAKQKLDAAADEAENLSGWYISPQTNKVVVQAQPGKTDDAWAFAKAAGLNRSEIAVETAPRAQPFADIGGGDPYIINNNARCSVGFSVEGGFVTAGHCGAEGADTSSIQGAPQGEVQASVFPGEADMGFVATDGDETPQPVINADDGPVAVEGSEEAPVGAAVCRTGSTTGTFCGRIEAKDQTVVYPEGQVTGLTRTDVCAEGGDSGGPFFSGGQAQGVTSGGSGDCTSGGITFFQPVNEILAANNLTLLTQGGGEEGGEEPPAEEPPAEEEPPAQEEPPAGGEDACPELPVQFQGELAGPRRGVVVPNGRAFRARAGEQTACLTAPEGADFDLALQRRTVLGNFRTVARATGDEAVKTLSFTGRAGTYRYVVVSSSGSGAFTLGIGTP